MKRVVEPQMSTEEREAYDTLLHLKIVDAYFLGRALRLMREGRKVLDVGCGIGSTLRSIGGDYELYGIDIDAKAISIAQAKDKKASYTAANAENMPYENASFDLVMCHSTLHHMEDPRPAINEINRVAKPEGAVFIRDLSRPCSEEGICYILKHLAPHYNEINKRLFADSLRSSFEYGEWQNLFPDFKTSSLPIYNIAERASVIL